jgi:deoxyribodipyrimidine photo-lyase
VQASSLHFSADVGPFARRRQEEVKRALSDHAVEVVVHPGLFAVDALGPIRMGAGRPYTVFTPFYKKWLSQPRREVLGASRVLAAPGNDVPTGDLPTLRDRQICWRDF